jgi:serine/threonine protein kinase
MLFMTDGNLAEMLMDEVEEEAPLPQDQSLYYLQQILEGVNFVHQSGYIHLNIKSI